jgi:hypothetical protein
MEADGLAVDVRVAAFEDASLPNGSFDLAVAATSFHWIDQHSGLRAVANLLRPGGGGRLGGTCSAIRRFPIRSTTRPSRGSPAFPRARREVVTASRSRWTSRLELPTSKAPDSITSSATRSPRSIPLDDPQALENKPTARLNFWGPAADVAIVRDRIPASSIQTFGLCLATLAFTLWAMGATAIVSGPLHRDAASVLEQSPVHRTMANRVAGAIAAQIPTGGAVDPVVLAAVADATLEQPAFVAAFANALDQVQEHVMRGTVNPISLDPVLVAQAARDASAGHPELAAALSAGTPIVVGIPDDDVPDLSHWADLWQGATRVFAFFALVLVTYGALRVEHRAWALGRICRWAIVVGVASLALFWVLPRVLEALGGWIGVGGVVLGGNDTLVPIAFVLIAGGIAGVVTAHRFEAHDRRRVLSAIPGPSTRGGATNPWESPV